MKKLLLLILLLGFLFVSSGSVLADSELLSQPWNLSSGGGASEKYQGVSQSVLQGGNSIQVTYDLNGACILGGDASAIIFDQNGWRFVSLSNYGQNCFNGEQVVNISLFDFPGLDTDSLLTGSLHSRFWLENSYSIDITSIVLLDSSFPTPVPTPVPEIPQWEIRSVSSMKSTKDTICNPKDETWINQWLDKAVELGVNYVAISQPYDSPVCGDSLAYTTLWVDAIRNHGLKVWHRHMPLSHEGIYNIPKDNTDDYFDMISSYIKNNPGLFEDGDIFTPIPEPQNGGIEGVIGCTQQVCQYSGIEDFNRWIKSAMLVSELSFDAIGKSIKIGYFGFDGFVTWGHNNSDWEGILYDSTISRMGNITIDHYPELVGTDMGSDLDELNTRYPDTDIYIGEWGAVSGGDTEQQVTDSVGSAYARSFVKGFNYWHLGPEGQEALIDNNFNNHIHFDEMKQFFE
jgi:hypothetical protein